MRTPKSTAPGSNASVSCIVRYGLSLISSREYQGLNDDDKRRAFKILNSRSKRLVKENRESEAPSLLNPSALMEALQKSKDDD